MHTRISYWVRTNETAFMEMSPFDIAEMLKLGYKLDIRIHQEYTPEYRTKIIYG